MRATFITLIPMLQTHFFNILIMAIGTIYQTRCSASTGSPRTKKSTIWQTIEDRKLF
jgi:hypothetical protein